METCRTAATLGRRLDEQTMRAAYSAIDRPDVSETVKMLAQAMSKPREGHVGLLKRLVRYLAGSKRMVIVHGKQDARDAHLDVLIDSDWAGDVQNGRLTAGAGSWRVHRMRSAIIHCRQENRIEINSVLRWTRAFGKNERWERCVTS